MIHLMINMLIHLHTQLHSNLMIHYRERDGRTGYSMCWLMLVALIKCCRNDESSYKAASGLQARRKKKRSKIHNFLSGYFLYQPNKSAMKMAIE